MPWVRRDARQLEATFKWGPCTRGQINISGAQCLGVGLERLMNKRDLRIGMRRGGRRASQRRVTHTIDVRNITGGQAAKGSAQTTETAGMGEDVL